MARSNLKVKSDPIYTAEGAKAVRINDELQLRRLCLATMLFEDGYYSDGKTIAEHIKTFAGKVPVLTLSKLAKECRKEAKLRHVPLFLTRELARRKEAVGTNVISDTLSDVIQRADELSEFLAMYWKDQKGKKTLSAQVKKGLAKAFTKFSAYDLAKYNQDNEVKLRDVLFLCHAKAKDKDQEEVWKKLVEGTLEAPDTWEVLLSAGEGKKDSQQKKDVWEKLLKEKKLGALALVRNLRNMQQASVDMSLIRDGLKNIKVDRVLPFRFITAAKHNPKLEPELETAMLKCLSSQEKIPGKTVLLIDVSGSMGDHISGRSELQRTDAAAAIAVLLREICEDVSIYCTAGSDYSRVHKTKLIPARNGFALRDAIQSSYNDLGGGGIFLVQCMDYAYQHEESADRVIVLTDEQDCDIDPAKAPEKANAFGKTNYLINVASEKNGIGYGKWHHIDGFSEAVIDYIREYEKLPTQ